MSSARALLYLLVAPLLTAATFSSLADPASAEARPQPAVEPQAVALWRFDGTAARVLVIADDGGSQDGIRDLRLFHTATPGLAVEIEPAKDAPPGQAVWEVSVRAAPEAPDRGFADFYVSGKGAPGDPGSPATWLPAGHARLTVGVQPPRDASPVADSELSIETDSATADEYAPAIAYLKIQNTSNHPLRFADLEILAPPFLDVRPGAADGTVAGHETKLLPLEIRVREPPRTGEWPIRMRVALSRGDGPHAQRGVALVERTIAVGMPDAPDGLKVEPAREGSPAAAVRLAIKTDFKTIDELAPVTAYLVIENVSVRPVRFEGAEIRGPAFLDIEPALRQAEIAPHATLIVPFELKLNDRPRIGEWLLLASVTIARGSGPLEQRGIGVVEQTVAVGVPGVSEVLKLLELPSVLLVPGALILATWSLLLGGSMQNQPGWLQWKTSSFWLVAVTLSIGVFGALTLLQRRFGIAADFLLAFGIRDAAWLWLGSVGSAGAAFALHLGARSAWAGWQTRRAESKRRRDEPLSDDSPLQILKKLERARIPFYLESYRRDRGQGQQTLYALGFPPRGGNTWAIPKMLLKQRVQPHADISLLGRIENANNRPADGLGDLIRELEAGLAEGSVAEVVWESGEIGRPQTLAQDDLGVPGLRASPLEIV